MPRNKYIHIRTSSSLRFLIKSHGSFVGRPNTKQHHLNLLRLCAPFKLVELDGPSRQNTNREKEEEVSQFSGDQIEFGTTLLTPPVTTVRFFLLLLFISAHLRSFYMSMDLPNTNIHIHTGTGSPNDLCVPTH